MCEFLCKLSVIPIIHYQLQSMLHVFFKNSLSSFLCFLHILGWRRMEREKKISDTHTHNRRTIIPTYVHIRTELYTYWSERVSRINIWTYHTRLKRMETYNKTAREKKLWKTESRFMKTYFSFSFWGAYVIIHGSELHKQQCTNWIYVFLFFVNEMLHRISP